MEDFMMWDGHNIFGVIFLIVFVVGLSCGLLGFICTRLFEDTFGEGIKPSSVFMHRRDANGMILIPPTRITVTRPPRDDTPKKLMDELEKDNDSQSEKGDGNNQESGTIMSKVKDLSIFKKRSKSERDESPEVKTIYSCNNSPLVSPTASIKRFFWSKSNNFDYNTNSGKDHGHRNHNHDSDNALLSRPISFDTDDSDKDKNVRVEVSSPMGMYNHILTSRCYSAPSRPHVNRTDTILYI